MQDMLVFFLIGIAAIYLGWKWFGKSGSSCGCGCECSLSKDKKENCCSQGECIEDHRQK